jgi:potassium-transporting ATPase KdpC subunit
MLQHLRPALVLFALLSALTGLAYPLAMTGVAQFAFRANANGSLIEKDGKVVGSALIGQNFTEAKYFWGRPSATSAADPNDPTKAVAAPYNAAASSGANKGPTAKDFVDRVAEDVAKLKAAAGDAPIPVDAVTASGSGLDPHISPEHAALQVARVAKARGLSEERVRQIVAQHTSGRVLGILGEPTVNVLQLNRALDGLAPVAGS